MSKKGLGKFADLMSARKEREDWCFRRGRVGYPNAHYFELRVLHLRGTTFKTKICIPS